MQTYADLLVETTPERIETEEQYDRLRTRFSKLIIQRRRTADEDKLMNLLAVLIADYDRRHALPPDDATPAERLQFLMEHSGKTSADLIPIFGQRGHLNEALHGKRPISVTQARKLSQLFHVGPAIFI